MTGTPNRLMITISVMLATVIHALDATIANVALPHMQGSLSATIEQVSWVLTSYVLASAVSMPLMGYLAVRMGRKRVLLVCVLGFTLLSMLCGVAQSLPQMVVFRVLQGFFGAGLVPISQTLLLDVYPREKHGQAMAMWGMGVMLGPILGPLVGGYLTDYYNWRWVFYINLPIGLLALAGIWRYVPDSPPDASRPFDMFGFVLLSVAIGSFQIMLDRGESLDWFDSIEVIAEAVIAGLALYLLIVHMFTSQRPFVEPALFTDRNFVLGLGVSFFSGLIMLATVALIPPMMQQLMDYPVITTGLVLMPRGAGTMLMMMVVGRIIAGIDVRWLLLAGFALIALSLWQMTHFTLDVGVWPMIHTGFTQGLGLGLIFVASTTATFATLPMAYRAEGTALYSVLRNLGSSVGVAIVVTMFSRQHDAHQAILSESVTPFSSALRQPGFPALWDWSTPGGMALLQSEVSRQAAMAAYLNDFHLILWFTIVLTPLAVLFKIPREATAGP